MHLTKHWRAAFQTTVLKTLGSYVHLFLNDDDQDCLYYSYVQEVSLSWGVEIVRT